ncbi:MAG: polyprenyl synthetase family protein [Clostridia bacterium]|nr:polyprenyl synthetase family protein [Clostridia bacterium]
MQPPKTSGTSQTAPWSFLSIVRAELELVEERIREVVRSEQPLVEEMALHLLQGGGKRLRPALVLLCGTVRTNRPGSVEALVPVAAAVEIIHMATLVHDDAIDRAETRRNVPTVNARWGDVFAILMGDYLFAKGFGLLASTRDNRVVRIMSDVVFQMCTGEVQQLTQSYDVGQEEAAYLDRVDKKTAYFIAESCRLGALVAGVSEEEEQALREFGFGLGMCYQIVDDILDLVATPERLGKPVGSDLRGGVITLPVLYALRHSARRHWIARTIARRRLDEAAIAEIASQVAACGAIEYAYAVAERYARMARERLRLLPASRSRDALATMAEELIRRDF